MKFHSIEKMGRVQPMPSGADRSGEFVVTAPGRVNLIGEHTDYNEGLVLPMAVERCVRISVRRRDDRLAVWKSEHDDAEVSFDLKATLVAGRTDWARYPAGVIAGYQRLGWLLPGFEAEVSATLPVGGGLSSSAALEVATATVVETLCAKSLPPEQRALLCQQAEHEFAGVPCGIMDQYAVTFARAGHALLLDCHTRAMRHVPIGGEDVGVLVINSGVKHSLADGEYAKRRAQCAAAARMLGVVSLRDVTGDGLEVRLQTLPEPVRSRARHVVTEHGRTLEFVAALERRDWIAAAKAMYGSHDSLRRDYEVSCAELDALVDISRGIAGVHGCRMTGGGFGGCVVALIERAQAREIMDRFRREYFGATGMNAELFVTKAAGGPRVV